MDQQASAHPPSEYQLALESMCLELQLLARTDARWIGPDASVLHPEEAALVANASAVRRREFASGRALLHLLLATDEPILADADRRPIAPPGWRLSLAHDRQLVVAVVTDDPAIESIGIDVEPSDDFDDDVARLILRPDERGHDPVVVFVAKEAAYKAWSQNGGRFLDHSEMRVHPTDGRFVARVMSDATEITGAWRTVGGRCLGLATIPAAASGPDGV